MCGFGSVNNVPGLTDCTRHPAFEIELKALGNDPTHRSCNTNNCNEWGHLDSTDVLYVVLTPQKASEEVVTDGYEGAIYVQCGQR